MKKKVISLAGVCVQDPTGREFIITAENQGPYGGLFELSLKNSDYTILESAYELVHYYKKVAVL